MGNCDLPSSMKRMIQPLSVLKAVAGAFQRVNDLVQDHPTWKLLQK
jgi:hypothetical protein